MKTKSIFFLVLLMLSSTLFLKAQNRDYKLGLGVHPSMFSFFTLNENNATGKKIFDYGVHFSINRYLNASFDLGAEGAMAILRHPFSDDMSNPLLRENFYTFHPLVKYKFYNGYIFGENFPVGPFIKAGVGFNKLTSSSNFGIFTPFSFGINFRLGKSASLVAQTTYNLGVSNAEDYLQHSIGLVINLRGMAKRSYNKKNAKMPDQDNDGVADINDKCPNTPGREGKGCPDFDGDGVLDDGDACPEVKGYANMVGCIDSDHDGLIDPDDACPQNYGPMHMEGCPSITKENDKDRDRIPDDKDACPDEPGLFTTGGCPDNDGDGIKNQDDLCPDKYGFAQHQGCPYDKAKMDAAERGGAVITNPTTTIVRPSTTTTNPVGTGMSFCEAANVWISGAGRAVYFHSGSSTIKSESHLTLNQVANYLGNCPSLTLTISAHTDSDGTAANNMSLSERRANAVKKYLVSYGAKQGQIETKAFGETQPIADNNTTEGKQQNRRVEFSLR